MKKLDAEVDRIVAAFGGNGQEAEFVPMIMPMQSYKMIIDCAKKLGITPADVIARALELFLAPKQAIQETQEVPKSEKPGKIAIIRRRS